MSRTAAIVSVHMDLGAGRRGVDMGPSAIRIAGLHEELEAIEWAVEECGSIIVEEAEAADVGAPNARYAKEITAVCRRLYDRIRRALAEQHLPICLGGDHAVAMGSVAAVAAHHRERGGPIGLIWIDAHTDMNTPETSPSGNIHGMPLAHLLGYGLDELVDLGGEGRSVDPRHVALLGIRSVDRRERELVKASGVRVFTMSEIDRRGIAACTKEALAIALDGTAGVHLSLDLDGVDPRFAPGVGTQVPGGLTYRETHLCCEEVSRSGRLLGLDVVELNPVIDANNETGVLAVDLIGSALGKTIL